MKILQAHNFYQLSGGEDTVVKNEKLLLEENGHEVISYYRRNDEIEAFSFKEKISLLKTSTWSNKSFREISELLQIHKIDVCHVHNFLPLISPSIYYACEKQKVPVVQTLHNYRIACTNGLFYRNNQVCEECIARSAYHSVLKKCYRNSYIQTYTVARMLEKHKALKTWKTKVDAYLCLNEFAREKFIAHGLPPNKLMLKPNFVDISSLDTEINHNNGNYKEDYFIYVGRLEKNKGVLIFKEIASSLNIKLKVVGQGALFSELKDIPTIELVGAKSHAETLELIAHAKALILPSISYEGGLPLTILEAFAFKTLVIASKLGVMESMIVDQKTGLLFKPGNSLELLKIIEDVENNKVNRSTIQKNAFQEYNTRYSKAANYKLLMQCYNNVIKK